MYPPNKQLNKSGSESFALGYIYNKQSQISPYSCFRREIVSQWFCIQHCKNIYVLPSLDINEMTPFFHSVVFWFGDLNFRIDDLDMQVVKSAIDNNKLPMLWEKDQVKNKCCLIYCIKKMNNLLRMWFPEPLSATLNYVSSLDAEISSRNVFQKAVHAKILTLDQCACEDISQKTGCTW